MTIAGNNVRGKLTHGRGLVTGRSTLIGLVRLRKNCHEERHGTVIIEDTEQKPNTPEDNQPVLVEADDEDSRQGGDHQEVFTHVESPVLIWNAVQDDVRKGLPLRISVVGKCKAEGCHQEPRPQEQTGKESLQWLLWYFFRRLCAVQLLWNVDPDGIERVVALPLSVPHLPFLVRVLYEGGVLHVTLYSVRVISRGVAV